MSTSGQTTVSSQVREQPHRYQPKAVRVLVAESQHPVQVVGAADWDIPDQDYPSTLTVGNLCLNLDLYKVTVAGCEVALTCQEFDLLAQLVVNKDSLVPFSVLTQWLWEATGRSYERRLRDVVHRLRSKLTALERYEIQVLALRGYGIFDRAARSVTAEPPRPMHIARLSR
jgi:DNA-binding response OmpR family regulator